MQSTISNAISTRQTLMIIYDPGERIIEPHALGYGSDGQLLLRAYQVSGESKSGEHTNWKLFRLDRIGTVGGNGDSFVGPRPGYNPNDPAMKQGIIVCL